LFNVADADFDSRVTGSEANKFFKRSGLPVSDLREIWEKVDSTKKGFLDKNDFTIYCDNVAVRQKSQLPKFDGIQVPTLPPKQDLFQSSSSDSQDPKKWEINEQLKIKYDNCFKDADKDRDGIITGHEARDYLSKSNLPNEELSKIWQLADRKKRGFLNKEDFRILMHLVYARLANLPIPNELPQILIDSSENKKENSILDDIFNPNPSKPTSPKSNSNDLDIFGVNTNKSKSNSDLDIFGVASTSSPTSIPTTIAPTLKSSGENKKEKKQETKKSSALEERLQKANRGKLVRDKDDDDFFNGIPDPNDPKLFKKKSN